MSAGYTLMHIQLAEALAANQRANLIIGQQAAEMKALQDALDNTWSPATQAHYEKIEAELGRAKVVIGHLYAALDGLRDRYVPNDAARPEVAAADQALDQCRRFFPYST